MESKENKSAHYRLWLANELASRTNRNPLYSLRSFSENLGISPATLSQVISGKRPLARKTAKRIIERCSMSEEEANRFLSSTLDLSLDTTQTNQETENQFDELDFESFKVISDWYHYAILSLGDLETNRSTPEWISKRLNITPKEAREGFNRLLKLGLVERKGLGFRQIGKPIKVPTLKENHAIRKYHLQNLQKAQDHVVNQTAPLEMFSAITMAVDENRLEEAREIIKKFRRKLCQTLEQGKRKQVYTLAVQLFPVTEKGQVI